MPMRLSPIDLSTVMVGSQVFIDLSPASLTANSATYKNPAHLYIYNESGSGLMVDFMIGGESDVLPAGAWKIFALTPGEIRVKCLVQYIIPGAPVTLLNSIFYAPGESYSNNPILGNSPVGVGGSISVSSANQLKNDGNAPNTSVVETTQVNSTGSNASLDNSGNLLIAEWNAVLLRYTVLLQTLANQDPCVILGANNRTVEVLGNFLTNGLVYSPSATGLELAVNNGGDVRINMQTGGNTSYNVPTGSEQDFQVNGTNIASVKSDGLHVLSGGLKLLQGGFSKQVLQIGKSFNAGTSTYTHGLGYQPGWLIIMETDGNAVPWGWDNPSPTTINIINGGTGAHSVDLLFLNF